MRRSSGAKQAALISDQGSAEDKMGTHCSKLSGNMLKTKFTSLSSVFLSSELHE